MRTLLRICLISVLTVSLIDTPVFGGPSRALGLVTQADHAHLGSSDAETGATVFDGDRLSTDPAGTMQVRLTSAQLYLLQDSGTKMHRMQSGASVVLERGTLVLASVAGPAVELRASEARIRPKAAQQTLAQVTLVGPNELLVTSNRGDLEVTIGEENHIVPENTSYRVEIEPSVPNPQGGPPIRAARSRFTLIALILIAVATSIIIWRVLVSPDRL